jgi:ribosomal protein L44E
MTSWRLRCTECGKERILKVSYDLASMGKIYHYCPHCKKNTFHIVLERIED